jgi:hypothetical protein
MRLTRPLWDAEVDEELHQEPSTARVAATVVVVGLGVFVVVWFQPQKLFIEERVEEDLPSVTKTGEATEETASSPLPQKEPEVLLKGAFSSLEHETTGTAKVVELDDGRKYLRFEDLETSNGPDLRVYLSEIPASDDWYAYGERFVDLGALKGNLGNQNYEIPDGVDLGRFESAVIWCRRFTVGFGVAGLS